MSTLVAVVFNDETTAFEMRAALVKMQKELSDRTRRRGRRHPGPERQDEARPGREPDVRGRRRRRLLGHADRHDLPQSAPRRGVGAGAGALSGKFTDIGLDDKMMKDIAPVVQAGHLRRSSCSSEGRRRDKVLAGLKEFAGKGKVFQTSLNKDDEAALREALEKPDR